MGNIDTAVTDANRADSQVSNQCLKPASLGKFKSVPETDPKLFPDRYMWDAASRNGDHFGLQATGQDQSKPTLVLPVINLEDHASQNPSLRAKVVKEIGLAAENFGFFQVSNHGIPRPVIERMISHGKEFFALPMEVKERALNLDPEKNSYYQGYHGRFQHLKARAPWLELFGENERPVSELDNLTRKIWPDGNPSFCQSVRDYSEAMCQVGRKVLGLLGEHLELESDYFSKHFAEEKAFQTNWRYNYYPACPRPDLTLGVAPHTDPNALTILTQNDVCGFQLWNGKVWFDINPVRDTLLVNIGDTLKAWTNGRLRSALHRAVVNEQSARLSIIYFMSPPKDTCVGCRSCPVDSDSSEPAWSHTFRSYKLYKSG